MLPYQILHLALFSLVSHLVLSSQILHWTLPTQNTRFSTCGVVQLDFAVGVVISDFTVSVVESELTLCVHSDLTHVVIQSGGRVGGKHRVRAAGAGVPVSQPHSPRLLYLGSGQPHDGVGCTLCCAAGPVPSGARRFRPRAGPGMSLFLLSSLCLSLPAGPGRLAVFLLSFLNTVMGYRRL